MTALGDLALFISEKLFLVRVNIISLAVAFLDISIFYGEKVVIRLCCGERFTAGL